MQEQKIQINNIRKLFDINQDSVNFLCKFNITSIEKKPFQILIIDQTTMDNTENLNTLFKTVDDGFISGQVKVDKNVYDSYYLILRSDNEQEVNIQLEKTEIEPQQIQQPPRQLSPEPQPQQPPTAPLQRPRRKNTEDEPPEIQDKMGGEIEGKKTRTIKSFFSIRNILIIAAVIGIGFFVYKNYKKSKNTEQVIKSPELPNINLTQSPSKSPIGSPSPSVGRNFSPSSVSSLADRLKPR